MIRKQNPQEMTVFLSSTISLLCPTFTNNTNRFTLGNWTFVTYNPTWFLLHAQDFMNMAQNVFCGMLRYIDTLYMVDVFQIGSKYVFIGSNYIE